MIPDHVVDGFYELFEGRDDVVFIDDARLGLQQLKEPPTHWAEVHLTSFVTSIGVYPLRVGRECKWICSDFDKGDTALHAHQLAAAWGYYGVQPWVETSKSKGHHVWVFLDDWTSGTIARRAALYVHQIAGVPADEVNPKQEITDGYGNCVRLPYWAGRDPGRMQVGDHSLEDFVEAALDSKADPDVIFMLANRYVPEPKRQAHRDELGEWDGTRKEGDYHLRNVWFKGEEVYVGERDNVVYGLANYAHSLGYSYAEAEEIMTEIWEHQIEDNASYPLETALSKFDRVWRERGGI